MSSPPKIDALFNKMSLKPEHKASFDVLPTKQSWGLLTWDCVYKNYIGENLSEGVEETVSLLYGREKNSIKEVVFGIDSCEAVTQRQVDGHGVGFCGLDVMSFLCVALEKMLFSSVPSKMEHEFRDTTVFVKTVRDTSYVQPIKGDVIDGYRCKVMVLVGFRSGNIIRVRNMERATARRLVTELKKTTFIATHTQSNDLACFNVFFGLLLMRTIEGDTEKWSEAADNMLSIEGLVEETVDGVLQSHQLVLKQQIERLRRAFNVNPGVLDTYYDKQKATHHLRAILQVKEVLTDPFYAALFD
jgi:hypothetical protein